MQKGIAHKIRPEVHIRAFLVDHPGIDFLRTIGEWGDQFDPRILLDGEVAFNDIEVRYRAERLPIDLLAKRLIRIVRKALHPGGKIPETFVQIESVNVDNGFDVHILRTNRKSRPKRLFRVRVTEASRSSLLSYPAGGGVTIPAIPRTTTFTRLSVTPQRDAPLTAAAPPHPGAACPQRRQGRRHWRGGYGRCRGVNNRYPRGYAGMRSCARYRR